MKPCSSPCLEVVVFEKNSTYRHQGVHISYRTHTMLLNNISESHRETGYHYQSIDTTCSAYMFIETTFAGIYVTPTPTLHISASLCRCMCLSTRELQSVRAMVSDDDIGCLPRVIQRQVQIVRRCRCYGAASREHRSISMAHIHTCLYLSVVDTTCRSDTD
jgi:hypothetical protein